jgi:hypothetical protein
VTFLRRAVASPDRLRLRGDAGWPRAVAGAGALQLRFPTQVSQKWTMPPLKPESATWVRVASKDTSGAGRPPLGPLRYGHGQTPAIPRCVSHVDPIHMGDTPWYHRAHRGYTLGRLRVGTGKTPLTGENLPTAGKHSATPRPERGWLSRSASTCEDIRP